MLLPRTPSLKGFWRESRPIFQIFRTRKPGRSVEKVLLETLTHNVRYHTDCACVFQDLMPIRDVLGRGTFHLLPISQLSHGVGFVHTNIKRILSGPALCPYPHNSDPIYHKHKCQDSPPSLSKIAVDLEYGSIEEQEGQLDKPGAGEEEHRNRIRPLSKSNKKLDEDLLRRRRNQSPLDRRDVVTILEQSLEQCHHRYHGQQGHQMAEIVPLQARLVHVTNHVSTR